MKRSAEAIYEQSSGSQPRARLLNLKQAAEYLGISFWSIRDYALAGLIPTVQLPALRPREGDRPKSSLRRVLIDVADLDAFIARHKSNAEDVQSRASGESFEERRGCARPVPISKAVQKPERQA